MHLPPATLDFMAPRQNYSLRIFYKSHGFLPPVCRGNEISQFKRRNLSHTKALLRLFLKGQFMGFLTSGFFIKQLILNLKEC